jgi:hypothetical protein
MIAAGIDLGGTKIETQIFDADWQPVARQRIATPPIIPPSCRRSPRRSAGPKPQEATACPWASALRGW